MIREEGYSYGFSPSVCASCGGACCIGESGYIWVNYQEIQAIAEHLELGIEEFSQRYLRRAKSRYSLNEYKVEGLGYACVFFDTQRRICSIYNVRPKQCRTFPFWEQFKNNTKDLIQECPGVIVDENN